jgi:signal transduction histidine kinase/ActR/RegA family two-component response regulator
VVSERINRVFKSAERRNLFFFGALLVVLLANVVFSYLAVLALRDNEQRVQHTYQVLSELDAILTKFRDAGTESRSYQLTGDAIYLAPFHAAVESLNEHTNLMEKLTADNPDHQQLLEPLEQKIRLRLQAFDEDIQVRKSGDMEAVNKSILSVAGRSITEEIRQLIAQMKARENLLLQQREAVSKASAQQANFTFIAISLLAAVMLAIFYYQVKRSIAERTALLEAERTARAQAETAFRAEQEARSEIEAANRLKDEFLATVSHELRTPLNAILGWARLIRTGKLDDDTFERALDTIERNAKSQAQLVEDLLDVSRIISGKLRLDIRPVDLTMVIEAAIDAVRPAADAKDIQIRKVLDPKAGLVSGDPERLQQVIWNLLSNAVKFTPKAGKVEVRLERVNSHIELIVSDNGKGMRADFLPHAFELFRQADGAISRAYGGLGLGLAITRRIVEMHGGAIHADSPGEDQGAIFTVQLPLRAVRALEASNAHDGERAHPTAGQGLPLDNLPALDGLRILAVDDQHDTLEMIKVALEQCGAIVQTVTTAREAFELLKTWNPDLLVADIGMPGEDGYTLIGKIRALKPEQGGTVPAVALTAYARVEDRVKTLSAGYQMHVPKPVEPLELMTIIASLVGRTGKTPAT